MLLQGRNLYSQLRSDPDVLIDKSDPVKQDPDPQHTGFSTKYLINILFVCQVTVSAFALLQTIERENIYIIHIYIYI